MASERDEGDPAYRERPGSGGVGRGAAFAATIAPETTARPGPPAILPIASGPTAMTSRRLWSALESDVTIDAPPHGNTRSQTTHSLGDEPVDELSLPIVSSAHYRPERELARGGMGRIVAAEDQRLGRSVALKELLEPSPEQIGRFEREALITARLQHPGIVPVYEAGRWPSGEPFFAMKLVSGEPLDRVIAKAPELADRLALLPRLAAATDAIAYAHDQRVIHRDLKPANVLIGRFGETVVIDWGLAKHLDDVDPPGDARATVLDKPSRAPATESAARRDSHASTLTIAGAVMGTPAYMAPEQARGEPVDQRADVFALGAMLYHLLAGVPPYNARTATDVIAAAASGRVVPLVEREPGAPADLVAIVERAMAPRPSGRYGDAGELASELRRFLTGQLVSAHRYTAAQRIARFVNRHRAAVMIAVVAAIGFAAGGTFAVRRILHERDLADHERRIADTRRTAAEHLIDRMLSDVRSRLTQMGRLDVLASLGTEIRDYYATLAQIPGGMPADDVDRMAVAVDLIGIAERDSGKLDDAFATWSQLRTTLVDAVAGDLGEPTRLKRRMIARLDHSLGTIHQQRGKLAAAIETYTLARRELAALRDEAPGDRGVLLAAADNLDRLGDLHRTGGRISEAFDAYREAREARERAITAPHGKPDEVLALSTSRLKLGALFQARGESAKALDEYRAGLALREGLLDAARDNAELQTKVLEVQLTLGDLQRVLGDPASAIATYDKALPVMGALTRRDPANTTWRRLRGNLEADHGFALLDRGDYAAGHEQLRLAIATQQALVDLDPESAIWQGDLSRSYTRAGDAKLNLGEVGPAIALYQHALAIRSHLVAQEPASAPYRRSVAWSHAKLAAAYLRSNEPIRARAACEDALALRTALVAESPEQSGFRNELAASELALGRMLAQTAPERAAQLIASGLSRARSLADADPINLEWKETLIQGLLAEAWLARATRRAHDVDAILGHALALTQSARAGAPDNVRLRGYLAEVHAGLAERATARGDRDAAAAARQAIRDALEPLAKSQRLAADRKALLELAR